MVDIAGKPMIQWVLDALSGCTAIQHVTVVGLPPYTNLYCEHREPLRRGHPVR
jgi:NDP-sugar pyrophosphorylase family protein